MALFSVTLLHRAPRNGNLASCVRPPPILKFKGGCNSSSAPPRGFRPETCWNAHCKELYGLPLDAAQNRLGANRAKPCPPEKRVAIKKAFGHFGMLQ
jgi:hypothetical protein